MMDVISNRAFDSHPRSIAKALSWRTLGSIDTFVLSWIVTGNFVWAGSIASFEVVTKMILYYFHERGWSHIKWGLERPKRPQTVDAAAEAAMPASIVSAFAEPRWRADGEMPAVAAVATRRR